jgi:sulfonate transport system ATP-binding protein
MNVRPAHVMAYEAVLDPLSGQPVTDFEPHPALVPSPAVAPPPPKPAGLPVTVRGLGKHYGARLVLDGIDLSIAAGECMAVVGRSGCGKSTLLRLIAGLESISQGEILLDGKPVRPGSAMRQSARLMFQDARLLPWKTVAANVSLGLDGPDAAPKVLQALADVGLADRADDWPAALSGGQRQRVALARALVHRPRLLLLDEPLGALDALTRIEMQALVERLWHRHGCTVVLVTHDVAEAVTLADRIVLIEKGKVVLDRRVDLPYPRERGAAFSELEDEVLQRVLRG